MRELPENLAGCEIEQYRILALLGRGGMGEVWEAEDTKLRRKVAIKRVRAEKLGDPTAARRLVEEARAASKISHPYIASVYDVLQPDSDPLIVMERVEGETLHEYLSHEQPDAATVRRMGIQIAEALSAIHEAGLIHRDLKPANVMIAKSGHAKLMDFGLSTGDVLSAESLSSESESLAPTQTATTQAAAKGTPTYMSPEQLRGRRPDRRSDLFALGIVLYESLTGVHPFRQASIADTTSSILNDEPAAFAPEQRTTESDSLEFVARKLLEKQPENRYPTAAVVVETLRATSPGTTEATNKGIGKLLVGVASIALLALVGWLIFKDSLRLEPYQPIEVPGRELLAILPIEDRTDAKDGSSRGAMIASLMTSYFGEAPNVRALGQPRLIELGVTSSEMELGDRIERLRRASPTRWVVSGELFMEASDYVGTFDVLDTRDGVRESFSVSRPRATHLAHAAYQELHRRIDGLDPADTHVSGSSNDEAQALYERARQLRHDLEYAQALQVVRRAIDLDSGFVQARLLLAELLDYSGYEQEATTAIEELARYIEDNALTMSKADEWLVAARIEVQAGNRQAAGKHYEALVNRFPDEPRYLEALAYNRVESADYDGALGLYEQAMLYDPTDPSLHLGQARALALARQLDQAWIAAEQGDHLCNLFDLRSCRGEVATTRAYLHYRAAEFELAAETYVNASEAFRAAGLPVRALLSIKSSADAQIQSWDVQAANETLEQVRHGIRDAGHFRLLTRTLNSLGAVKLRLGEVDEACAVLDEAVALARHIEHRLLEHSAQANLGSGALLLGEMTRAGVAIRRSLEIAREFDDALREQFSLLSLGDEHRYLGHLEQGRNVLDGIVENRIEGPPGTHLHTVALQRLVWLELAAGDNAAALRAAEAAVEGALELKLDSTIGYSLCMRAIVQARNGLIAEARQDLEDARPRLVKIEKLPVFFDVMALASSAVAVADGQTEAALSQQRSGAPTEEGAELSLLQAGAALDINDVETAERMLALLREGRLPPSFSERARLLRKP